MAIQTVSALEKFVQELRLLCASESDPERRWPKAADLLKELLGSEELQKRSRQWPPSQYDNLLFYEDPDHGFVINALIKEPGARTGIHDHAHTWTLYGVLDGSETIERYQRVDDGTRPGFAEIHEEGRFAVRSGDVDLVRPWLIHAEANGDERTVAMIIRSQKLGSFPQNFYDPATSSVRQGPGPTPIPHAL